MENENEKKTFHLIDNSVAFIVETPPPLNDRGGQLIPFEEAEIVDVDSDNNAALYDRLKRDKHITNLTKWIKTDGQKIGVVIAKVVGVVIGGLIAIVVLLCLFGLYVAYKIVEYSVVILISVIIGLWDMLTTKNVSFDDWTEDKTSLPGQQMTGQATTNIQNNGGTVNVNNNFFK